MQIRPLTQDPPMAYNVILNEESGSTINKLVKGLWSNIVLSKAEPNMPIFTKAVLAKIKELFNLVL